VPLLGKGVFHAAQRAMAEVIICLAARKPGAVSNRRNTCYFLE